MIVIAECPLCGRDIEVPTVNTKRLDYLEVRLASLVIPDHRCPIGDAA